MMRVFAWGTLVVLFIGACGSDKKLKTANTQSGNVNPSPNVLPPPLPPTPPEVIVDPLPPTPPPIVSVTPTSVTHTYTRFSDILLGNAERRGQYEIDAKLSQDKLLRFTYNVYYTLLGRAPTSSETTALSDRSYCSASVSAILTNQEFADRFVSILFSFHLGRQPEPGALLFFSPSILSPHFFPDGWKDVISSILSSDEYYNGAFTVQDYIQNVFRATLGRSAEMAAVTYFTDYLATHSRKEMTDVVVGTEEFKVRWIYLVYRGLLQREPTFIETQEWLNVNVLIADILASVLCRAEYYDRL